MQTGMGALQHQFFELVRCGSGGPAGAAAPLMARFALNLTHDARAYPVDVSKLLEIAESERDVDMTGFNETLILDFLRAALFAELDAWDDEELAALKRVAGPPAERLRVVSLAASRGAESPSPETSSSAGR